QWMPETLTPEKKQPLHLLKLFGQYGRILSNKRYMFLLFVIGFIFTGFIVWITAGPLLIIQSFHYTPIEFGIIQAVIFAVFIFGNHLVKYIMEWTSVKKLIWLGLSITLSGGILVFLSALPNSLYPFLIAMAIYS